MSDQPRPLSRLELLMGSPGGDRIEAAAQPALSASFPGLPGVSGISSPVRPPPRDLKSAQSDPDPRSAPALRSGCYRLSFSPTDPPHPDWGNLAGTVRVETIDQDLLLSGDVYTVFGAGDLAGLPLEDRQIPVYPRDRYFAYFRSAAQGDAGASVNGWSPGLECLWHRIVSVPYNLWALPEKVLLQLSSQRGRSTEVVSPLSEEFQGAILNASGQIVGDLLLTRVSDYFREAVIEIDAEGSLEPPLDNGHGATWQTALGRAGWRVRMEVGAIEAPTPPIGGWTLSELHDAMLRSRNTHDLDWEWRYHIAVVRHIVGDSAPLGIAYDHEATDYNDVPREGVAVNAEARLPVDPMYGSYAGRLLRESPEVYFHVALHELGHAMGLYHNNIGPGVMRQVQALAEDAGALGLTDLPSEFELTDVFRLRHLPDIYVRPGGSPWETIGLVEDRDQAESRIAGHFSPKSRPTPAGPFALEARAVESEIPLGAPVRVDFQLRSRSSSDCFAPARLSLATPFVRGWVVGPDGDENEFRSLFKSFGDVARAKLARGESVADSVTLLRGHRGALVRRAGFHTLWLEVEWADRGEVHRTRQKLRFQVGAPRSDAQRRAARRLQETPESVWYLAIGRSGAFQAADRAIDQALDTDELRRHFAYLKARACSQRHFAQRENWRLIRGLLAEPECLQSLNARERVKAAALVKQAQAEAAAPAGRSV